VFLLLWAGFTGRLYDSCTLALCFVGASSFHPAQARPSAAGREPADWKLGAGCLSLAEIGLEKQRRNGSAT